MTPTAFPTCPMTTTRLSLTSMRAHSWSCTTSQHHRRYVDELNAALIASGGRSSVGDQPIDDLLWNIGKVPEESRNAVRNYGGGHANHSFFWTILSKDGGGKPSGRLAEAITEEFGSFTGVPGPVRPRRDRSRRQRLGMVGAGPPPADRL